MKNCSLAVYTCISGGYDSLRQPSAVRPGVEYLCFVPRGEKTCDNVGVWKIVEFESPASDPVIKSRYPKMMPHLFLSQYDFSLYVDANVGIVSDGLYDMLEGKMASGSRFSAPSHPINDCAYDEAEFVVKCSKDTLWHVLRTVRFLKKERFPRHFGLYENGVIFRRHNIKEVMAVDSLWWKLFVKYPKRDQLLLAYCLWKYNIAIDYLLPFGENMRNSAFFSYGVHGKKSKDPNDSFWGRKLRTFPKLIIRLFVGK